MTLKQPKHPNPFGVFQITDVPGIQWIEARDVWNNPTYTTTKKAAGRIFANGGFGAAADPQYVIGDAKLVLTERSGSRLGINPQTPTIWRLDVTMNVQGQGKGLVSGEKRILNSTQMLQNVVVGSRLSPAILDLESIGVGDPYFTNVNQNVASSTKLTFGRSAAGGSPFGTLSFYRGVDLVNGVAPGA